MQYFPDTVVLLIVLLDKNGEKCFGEKSII